MRVVTLFFHGDVHDFSWGARSSRAVVLGERIIFFGYGVTLLSLLFCRRGSRFAVLPSEKIVGEVRGLSVCRVSDENIVRILSAHSAAF